MTVEVAVTYPFSRAQVISFLACAVLSIMIANAAQAMPSSNARKMCNEDALGVSRTITLDLGSPPVHDLLEEKEVVLTFDDGPSPERTVRVLNALASECVTATFFLRGDEAEKHPETVRKITTRGHELGGHSFTHRRLNELAPDDAENDILRGIEVTRQAYRRTGDVPPVAFFRYPFLASSDALDAFLIENGLIRTDVTTDGQDWSGIGGEQIIENIMTGLAENNNKGVILLHDPVWATSHSVDRLLDRLKVDGFRIVAIRAGRVEPPS